MKNYSIAAESRIAEKNVRVHVGEKRVGLYIPNHDKAISLVKRLPTRFFDRKNKCWSVALDDNLFKAIDYLQNRLSMTIVYSGLDIQAAYESRIARMKSLSSVRLSDSFPLYTYQQEAVNFSVRAFELYEGVLNASEVGLGKTLMTIATLSLFNGTNTLIVVPKSVMYQWQDEWFKWLNVRPFVYAGGSKERLQCSLQDKQVVVTSYEILRADIDKISQIKWSTIIADEAHRLGNTDTKLYKAFLSISSDRRIALTATPIMNRLTELFGIIHWLSPHYLGTFTKFKERYCQLNYWGAVVGGQNLDELKQRLEGIVFRRTVEEAQIELPDAVYQRLPVVLSVKEKTLYKKIVKELLFEIEQAELSKLESPVILQNSLVKMGKLIELCDSMELLGDVQQSSKIDALKDHLLEVASNHKVIIFSRFKRMCNILQRELAEHLPQIITGDQTAEERARAVSIFSSNPDCRVLIGSDAMGAGLNLQVATVVYNYDLPWSVGKLIQRTGRARRIGQKKTVMVVNLVTEGTVEKNMEKLLLSKISLAREMIDNAQAFTTLDQVKEVLLSQ